MHLDHTRHKVAIILLLRASSPVTSRGSAKKSDAHLKVHHSGWFEFYVRMNGYTIADDKIPLSYPIHASKKRSTGSHGYSTGVTRSGPA